MKEARIKALRRIIRGLTFKELIADTRQYSKHEKRLTKKEKDSYEIKQLLECHNLRVKKLNSIRIYLALLN